MIYVLIAISVLNCLLLLFLQSTISNTFQSPNKSPYRVVEYDSYEYAIAKNGSIIRTANGSVRAYDTFEEALSQVNKYERMDGYCETKV